MILGGGITLKGKIETRIGKGMLKRMRKTGISREGRMSRGGLSPIGSLRKGREKLRKFQ